MKDLRTLSLTLSLPPSISLSLPFPRPQCLTHWPGWGRESQTASGTLVCSLGGTIGHCTPVAASAGSWSQASIWAASHRTHPEQTQPSGLQAVQQSQYFSHKTFNTCITYLVNILTGNIPWPHSCTVLLFFEFNSLSIKCAVSFHSTLSWAIHCAAWQ